MITGVGVQKVGDEESSHPQEKTTGFFLSLPKTQSSAFCSLLPNCRVRDLAFIRAIFLSFKWLFRGFRSRAPLAELFAFLLAFIFPLLSSPRRSFNEAFASYVGFFYPCDLASEAV